MNNWIIKESENYTFHYHKNSVAQNMIDDIVNTQELCFKHICKVLDVKFNNKIKYYLCNSPKEVGILYGDNEDCNAFARNPNEIYAVVNEDVQCIGYHEDSHIISYSINTPPQVFIREGLAMYFDKQHFGISNLVWAKYFISANKYISISKLIDKDSFYKYSWSLTYPIAGAFTEYLITIYGIGKYKLFYKSLNEDFKGCFNKVFGISLEEFERDFTLYLDSFKVNEKLLQLLNEIKL